jgi:hypothetical protein
MASTMIVPLSNLLASALAFRHPKSIITVVPPPPLPISNNIDAR